jgi:transcriptional regulator with XRE-family HTH domain
MLPNRIKQLRKERGLTQIQFANDFSIAQGTIGMWETGMRIPDTDTVKQLADYFDVSLDYLLGRTDIRKISTSTTNNAPIIADERVREIMTRIDSLPEEKQALALRTIESLIDGLSD